MARLEITSSSQRQPGPDRLILQPFIIFCRHTQAKPTIHTVTLLKKDPEFYELFRITFENILTDFLKTILTFRNNVPKHLWQWNIIEIFRISFGNNAEHFLNCFGTHFEMSLNTFENHLNVSEQCSWALLKNVWEHFWKYSRIFLKIVLIFRNNVPKHLWQCSGTL